MLTALSAACQKKPHVSILKTHCKNKGNVFRFFAIAIAMATPQMPQNGRAFTGNISEHHL